MADIAVIGLSCIFPGAADTGSYWQNIVSKVNSIGEPPPGWGAEVYFDPDAKTNDRIYCKRGGYLGDLATFDPFEYGVMPNSVDGGEPDHYLALRVADEALKDAGYDRDTINPEMTEVIIGRGTYINRGVTNLFQHGVVLDQTIGILKDLNPDYSDEELDGIRKALKAKLPQFIPETTSSLVPNVLAGRIANRLNLMGANYIVDAACASSLVAVEHGIRDLSSGRCDLSIVGGVNAYIPPPILMIFCQINALSRKQTLKAFDEAADGTLLGEGLGFAVLKRKEDAIRDGDRIYAVVKSVGVASDGRVLGLLAPRAEGQALAMKRAYDESGIAPDTIGLVEAHGTGVPVGDITEIESLRSVFGPRKGERPSCALGTVKSMISHLIPAAGIAGFIKTCLALHHKVLPPTLCEKPNPRLGLETTPFYINTETRPWIHGLKTPRRAAVNAFGFGGINAHAILEEHADEAVSVQFNTVWDSEAILLCADTREGLIHEAETLKARLEAKKDVTLKGVAYTRASVPLDRRFRLSMVASSIDELVKKLGYAADKLKDASCGRISDKSGIYYFEDHCAADGKVAFLFPGEGSQYPDMLSDLCIHFPEVREVFDLVDSAFIKRGREYLPSHTIFPLPLGQDGSADKTWKMDAAAESVFTSSQALLKMMELLEIRPDAMLGHSTGEYSALLAGGMLKLDGKEGFIDFVLGVNSVYEELAANGKITGGVLLAVGAADMEMVGSLVEGSGGRLFIAMENCPNQVVLCGTESTIAEAENSLKGTGAMAIRLPFARAYHTPMFKDVSDALRSHFDSIEVAAPSVDVYSCVTAAKYPSGPDEIRDLATIQWASKVRFNETIEAMYGDGVRVFIEVGPRGNLTAFVDDILRKRPHLAVPSNLHRKSGLRQINELVALLYASRVHVNPSALYARRSPVKVSWEGGDKVTKSKSIKINTLLPKIELGADAERFVKIRRGEARIAAREEEGISTAQTPQDMVMAEYLHNMEEFLKSQEAVLNAFVSGAPAATVLSGETPASLPLFIDRVVSTGEGEVISVCGLDIAKDRFLLDHTLGGKVSALDASLNSLPVVPLTFSMEILAGGGSLLFPGRLLTGMKEVRAYRWIGLDNGSRTLQVHAKMKGANEAHVRISDADPLDPTVIRPGMPLIEGTMVFGERYPAPSAPMELKLEKERPSRWAGKDLYEGFMFHGPTLQAVERMELWGENGATATLKAMPLEPLFKEFPPDGGFLSDPVVLDAAGQAIAYWTSDHLETGFHIFPFRLEELTLYGPCMRHPERAECRAAIALEGDSQVRSDIDIIDGTGFLRLRLKGWWDRRFDMPEQFYRLRSSITGNMVSTPVTGLFERAGVGVYCCVLEGLTQDFLESHDRIWERVFTRLILSGAELADFAKMTGVAKRRQEWLLGRAAAKDAVRMLSAEKYGRDIYPADIVTSKDSSGRPFVESAEGIGELPLISIAHTSGAAVAACCTGVRGIGIDMERVRELEEGFDSAAFTEVEIKLMSGLNPVEAREWRVRAWSAKEAAAKALGTGLMGRQKELVITSMDRKTGDMEVSLTREFIRVGGGVEKIKAYTVWRGEFIVAGAIIK